MYLPDQVREGWAVLGRVQGEGPCNGPTRVYGTVEDEDGNQEGFLNLQCECFNGMEEYVQERGDVFEFEIFMCASGDGLNMFIPGWLIPITRPRV